MSWTGIRLAVILNWDSYYIMTKYNKHYTQYPIVVTVLSSSTRNTSVSWNKRHKHKRYSLDILHR